MTPLARLDGSASQRLVLGDARRTGLEAGSVNLVVTSPPYWKKRDYGHEGQIGLESTAAGYVRSIMQCLEEWQRVMHPTASVFLNVGDTYYKNSLVGIPFLIEQAASADGWYVRNRIIWAKTGGMPDPVKTRLTNRHEYVLHLTRSTSYYYDLQGYSEEHHNGSNPGDVWQMGLDRHMGSHLAPFPKELVRRVIDLTAPKQVCGECGKPRERITARTAQLDETRPQAKRAMELAAAANLTDEHIAAIQATGVSDAGKALKVQTGTGKNSRHVQRLAAEAKLALGGYFREFTFAKRITVGWTDCGHEAWRRGVVLDPFVGSGTTLKVAAEKGVDAVGIDLTDWQSQPS